MHLSLFSIFDPLQGLSLMSWLMLTSPLLLWSGSLYYFQASLSSGVASILILVQKELEVTSSVFMKSTGLLISTFYMVAVMNSLGLLPYVFTATSHLCVTLSIATTMFISGLLFQWSYLTKESLSHMVPSNCPTALMMFMVLVETLSLVIRPLTLSVRLMANMVAGHLIMALTAGGISSFVSLLTVSSAMVMLTVLELAVALIQAYVVVVLLSLYLSEV